MKKKMYEDYEYVDGEDAKESTEPKPFVFVHQTVIQNIYHFYISTFIEEAHHYVDMINKLQTAGPNDIVYMHLNTIGGYMTAGIQIINAMKASQAHVIAAIEGEVASLGTMLFLAADEFLVHENCSLMFHNYSGSVYGKGHEQVAALQSATKWTEDFMMRLYVPFMTEEEVNRLIKGEDIYMHPPEIIERLHEMSRIRTEEHEAAERGLIKSKKTPAKKKKVVKKKASKRKKVIARKKAPPKKGTWQHTYTAEYRKSKELI